MDVCFFKQLGCVLHAHSTVLSLFTSAGCTCQPATLPWMPDEPEACAQACVGGIVCVCFVRATSGCRGSASLACLALSGADEQQETKKWACGLTFYHHRMHPDCCCSAAACIVCTHSAPILFLTPLPCAVDLV